MSSSSLVKQVIVVRKDLCMRKGKCAAQVAHASQAWLFHNNECDRVDELRVKFTPVEAMWISGSFTKVVVSVDSEERLNELVMQAELAGVMCHRIVDAGRTEFHGQPTLTCAAFGPAYSEDVDAITGQLKLM